MSEQDMAQQLAAALDGHQITDDEGNLTEETDTSELESAPVEQTTEEESAVAETAPEETEEPAEGLEETEETDLAEDDSGKRYVPEERFKQIYGKAKATERELETLRTQLEQGNQLLEQTKAKPSKSQTQPKIDKADVLELRMTLPQFNPTSTDYSEDLDVLGANLLRANPQLSPLQAGQRAIEMAKKLSGSTTQARQEARSAKVQQADQGITNRVSSRGQSQIDPNKMDLDQMEEFLKDSGEW